MSELSSYFDFIILPWLVLGLVIITIAIFGRLRRAIRYHRLWHV
jgi:hypothetical protein